MGRVTFAVGRSAALLFATVFASVALFSSCTKDIGEVLTPQVEPETTTTDPYAISEEEALDNLFTVMDGIYGPATRASARAAIRVEAVTSGDLGIQTRSGTSTTNLAYVANFPDDGGYAILAARSTAPPVLALTESGNISGADILDVFTPPPGSDGYVCRYGG
jgi:hypothetical protein